MPPGDVAGPVLPSWMEQARREQHQVMQSFDATLSCAASFGAGGLGRHLQEMAEAGDPGSLTVLSPNPAGAACETITVPVPMRQRVLSAPPVRWSPAWRVALANAIYDAGAAGVLPAREAVFAFNGQAARQFEAAPAGTLRVLVSANCHLEYVADRHRLAHSQYPVEKPWGRGPVVRRSVHEYELADLILTPSDYVHHSFVNAGFEETRLRRFPLTPHDRFASASDATSRSDKFEIVYVGALSVDKGVPLLVEAFRRLPHDDARLVLVGGWSSRGMRRHLGQALVADGRISIAPGDPLPYLRRAAVYVQPSYHDACPYSVGEAVAAGVPVVVSAEVGTTATIEDGANGLIVPTGDSSALADALQSSYDGFLRRRGTASERSAGRLR